MTTRATIFTAGILAAVLVIMPMGCASDHHTSDDSSSSTARGAKQLMFDSPQEASAALIDAARREDREYLKKMFGPEVERLKTGDKRQDHIDLQVFVAACDVYANTAENPDGTYSLTIGEQEWVFPAPIVPNGQLWYFDTAAGIDEVITRTIGLNELNQIVALGTFVAAEEEYFSMDPDNDSVHAYAIKFRSSHGERDGLYWAYEDGAPMAPLGPLVARAVESGELDLSIEGRQPYRGYYVRVLTSQGAGAPGGAMNYIDSSGRLTGGYAMIAWPASYNETGVMSFMVSKHGTIYQKDLGEDTAAVVETITTFDPADGWQAVE